MTPLKPLEDLKVEGCRFGPPTYELNVVCSHPECTEPVGGKHHIWPKGMLKGDYWWVEIDHQPDMADTAVIVVPNVTGLCGSGTTGHHGDVESHAAWIKYEDGVFVWYDRMPERTPDNSWSPWQKLGPLNPQPGQVEGKPKRKWLKGEQRRKRRTISLRVPQDNEDGGKVWDETLERVKEALVEDELFESVEKAPAFEATVAALNDWLDRRPTWKVC